MSEDQNKTEKPTPFKLKEAKNKGQVSKSQELNAMVTLLAFLLLAYVFWQQTMADFQLLARHFIVLSADVGDSPQVLAALLADISWDALVIILPFFMILLLLGALANIAQTGVVLTAFPLTPDVSKLNPAKSLKRIFSKKTLFELFKSSLKIVLFAALIVVVNQTVINRLLAVYFTSPTQMPQVWADLFFQLAIWVLCLLVPVALLDYAYNRWDFMQQMMMSARDVKDEHKKREGDPQIKLKQKQIQRELMKKAASLGQIKEADVIITNPTHIAVALRYRHKDMPAPKVMAMGQDATAEKIKHIARRHNIPIMPNKTLARRLFKSSVTDGYIPFDCYDLVAPIFRQLMVTKGEQVNGQS